MVAAGWSAQAATVGRSLFCPHFLAQIYSSNLDLGGFRGVCGEVGLGYARQALREASFSGLPTYSLRACVSPQKPCRE